MRLWVSIDYHPAFLSEDSETQRDYSMHRAYGQEVSASSLSSHPSWLLERTLRKEEGRVAAVTERGRGQDLPILGRMRSQFPELALLCDDQGLSCKRHSWVREAGNSGKLTEEGKPPERTSRSKTNKERD